MAAAREIERVAPAQHDSLPDTPEPNENPLLVGHGEVTARLAQAYRAGKLHHALLLVGPRGIGKATFAFHLAQHLLANPDRARAPATFAPIDPASHRFRLMAQGAHPSILHLTRPQDPKGKQFKTVISVDEVRRVGRFLSLRSHDGSYRVVIVDPAEDMNRSAANALLKNLEEPPPGVLFVLIVEHPGRLLPTIRSRCQTIHMQKLTAEEVSRVLAAIGHAEASETVLARAGGSVREAILLQEFGGLEIIGAADAVLDARAFDPLPASKIADALTGRDNQVRFDIFNRHLLQRLADAGRAAGLGGNGARADRLAAAWQAASATVADTETYNLDRRQHIIGLLETVRTALSA